MKVMGAKEEVQESGSWALSEFLCGFMIGFIYRLWLIVDKMAISGLRLKAINLTGNKNLLRQKKRHKHRE